MYLLNLTDEELMQEVKSGQLSSMANLFEQHQLKLYNFFIKSCGNTRWSEDMVQECFTRMIKYAASFRADGLFLPWMFNIARNILSDYLRNESRNEGTSETELENFEGLLCDPEELTGAEEELSMLYCALRQLPHEKRDLILLSKISEVSHSDLAKIFDCSLNTVKVRLHRAIQTLQEHYEQQRSLTTRTNIG